MMKFAIIGKPLLAGCVTKHRGISVSRWRYNRPDVSSPLRASLAKRSSTYAAL